MRHIFFRLLNVVCIIGVLLYYQKVAILRSEEIREYEAQVEKADSLAKEYERMYAEANEEAAIRQYLKNSQFGDGLFTGIGQGYGGSIKVELLVKEHQLIELTIVSAEGEDRAYYEQAEKELPSLIIEAQGTDVDVVSGATFSSQGILEAAKEAITMAREARPSDEKLTAEWRKINEKE